MMLESSGKQATEGQTMQGTLIATFDEYGEILSWVVTPRVDLSEIVHSSGDTDEIRTYAIDVEYNYTEESLDEGFDTLAEVHALDAKKRSRSNG